MSHLAKRDYNVKSVGLDAVHTPSFSSILVPKLDNLKWRYILLVFALGTVGSWLLFGSVYALIVHYTNTATFQCFANVDNFASAYLYSLEIQVTIGFGFRYANASCWYGVILLTVHSIIGIVLQAFLLMVILNKLSRPVLRQKSIIFSDKIVMYRHKGEWRLKFRIGDVDLSSFLLDCRIDVQLIVPQVRSAFQQSEMVLKTHTLAFQTTPNISKSKIISWPTDVIHRIDATSPLRKYAAYLDRIHDQERQPLTRASIYRIQSQDKFSVHKIEESNKDLQMPTQPVELPRTDAVASAETPTTAGQPSNSDADEAELGRRACDMESFESGHVVVLFTSSSSANGQFLCSRKSYKLCTKLKIDHNFEPMLFFNPRSADSQIQIYWNSFDRVYKIADGSAAQVTNKKGNPMQVLSFLAPTN